MAHLTKAKTYDIKDSNIELLGSDLEKNVREHSGNVEPAWEEAGKEPGLQMWRIEKFKVKPWDKPGSFYDGDSYIVLYTYKASPDSDTLSYDLHFWLGENTSQDEAGTAAYKTVELDDHLHGAPVQYREVQNYESDRFLSYFPRFVCLSGGISTGFHHVTESPPDDIRRLYRIIFTRVGTKSSLVVRQVPPEASSLIEGDVYVLDMGAKVFQLNTKASAGQEKFKAAEFVRQIIDDRKGQSDLTVFDQGSNIGLFLLEFGEGTKLLPESSKPTASPLLFRLSDASGKLQFTSIPEVSRSSLSTNDVFLLDSGAGPVYVWVGNGASKDERRMAGQYAQRYLYQKKQEREQEEGGGGVQVASSIVKMNEGHESEAFFKALGV